MSRNLDSQRLLCGRHEQPLLANVTCDADGKVDVIVNELFDNNNVRRTGSGQQLHRLQTTVEACSWNVYAHKTDKQPKGRSTLPSLIDVGSDGATVRIGNQVFFKDSTDGDGVAKRFAPQNLSLSLDHVERHGRYIFVTSRYKATEVPEPDDESKEAESSSSTNDKQSDNKAEADAELQKTSKPSDRQSTDSESDSDVSDTDKSSSSEDELSASESWSEASTDLEEEGIHRIADLQPLPPPAPAKQNSGNADEESDSSSSDDDSSNPHACCSHESSDEDSSIIADNDNEGARMSESEENDMIDEIYENDPIERPGMSDSENNDDDGPDDLWDDHGYAMFMSDDDFDGFQAFESDSDDCSECGEDGGKACALPGADASKKGPAETENGEDETPVGEPVAQVCVYDASKWEMVKDGEKELEMPTRVFRYSTATGSPLRGSPLALHPKKPLLVWPLSDGKVLFADYRWNTYFVKRLRLSRMFSEHVSVQCRFSGDGRWLYIAALEKRGRPPVRTKKAKAGVTPATGKKSDEDVGKQDGDLYDLVLSTYRVSKGKTTRAPPVLVSQVKAELGSIKSSIPLPTYRWTDSEMYVVWSDDKHVKMLAVELLNRPISRASGEEQRLRYEIFTDILGGGAQANEAHYYLKGQGTEGRDLIIALRQSSVKRHPQPSKDAVSESGSGGEQILKQKTGPENFGSYLFRQHGALNWSEGDL